MVIFLLIAHSSTATSTPSAEHPLFLLIPHPSSNLPPHLWFVILLFGTWVTSSYLRVKPKSLGCLQWPHFPFSSFIFHLSLSGTPPWVLSMDSAIPPVCLLRAALSLCKALASSAGLGGGWLGSPAGKYLGSSPEVSLPDGKARGSAFACVFINPHYNFYWIPCIENTTNNQA